MTVGKFASRQTVKSRDIWQGLTIEPAPPSDPKREAAEAALQAERVYFAGRLVDAYCGGDSLVRAMLGLPLGGALVESEPHEVTECCPRGHARTKENIYVGGSTGAQCRVCKNLRSQAARQGVTVDELLAARS